MVTVSADVSNSAAIDVSKISGVMPLAGGTFTGDITIPDKIIHSGDSNTAIRFPSADTVTIETSGSQRFRVDSSGTIHTTQPNSAIGAIIKNTAHDSQLQILAKASNKNSVIFFGDAADDDIGQIDYDHNDNSLSFVTNATKCLFLDSSGNLKPGSDSNFDIGSSSNRFANGYFDTLYGDGSNLTGVTSTTINNNANNRLITGSGSANTLEGEADLNYSKESTSNHMLVLGGTDNTAAAWSGTRQGFKAIGSQPLLYLVDNGNTSGDDAYVGHAGSVLYVAKRGGSVAFQTAASGGSTTTRWTIGEAGHLEPNSTSDALNIGSSSKRVANIFTNDLHLSNEGHSNDVDSTWGNYTIQEGHEDLFLINHRTGKKFKFNLTEVS